LDDERESLLSQGESWTDVLTKKAVRAAKAIAKLNPSDFWTVVSEHGEYTGFVSLLGSARNASRDSDRATIDSLRVAISWSAAAKGGGGDGGGFGSGTTGLS